MKMILNILLMLSSLIVFSQTENELKMFDLMNQVRQNPTKNSVVVALDSLIKVTEKKLVPIKIAGVNVKQKIDSVEIIKYLNHLYETKDFLKNQTPLKSLTFNKDMYDDYKNYDFSKTKGLKHTQLRYAENIIGFEKDPVIALLYLIVDYPYDFNNKGHRNNIFNKTHTKTCVVENTLSEVTYIQGFK